MRRRLKTTLAALLLTTIAANARSSDAFRPPATPLVVHDPYFSIWSPTDRLTDVDPVHWTGKPHPLRSRLYVDGGSERIMGAHPADVHRMPQTGLEVLPTRTIYHFEGAGIAIALTFTTPSLPDDLDTFSRPLTYVSWKIHSTDGQPHNVQLVFDVGPELAVNTADQSVTWEPFDKAQGVDALRVGSVSQKVLERAGDDVRIDWGHAYLAVPADSGAALSTETQPPADGEGLMALDSPLLSVRWDLGDVGEQPVTRWAMLAYDDEYSALYFNQKLRPYWRRNGDDAQALLQKGLNDYQALTKKCEAFDKTLMADLEKVGGADYAKVAALAYRQSLGACKLVADANGQPLYFSKENFSNGCMGTVDVFYPQAPILQALSPALMKATLVPILDYASSPRWPFPFAPHDIGRYPHANGQVYGGGEKSEKNQMPVEESANMLILVAALARAEGSANFAASYWPTLTKWAEYLKEKGFDPENQLCTDDFAGHLAHNVNLSAKAIVALGAFGALANQKGDPATAKTYNDLAQSFATRWVKEADDGDHFRLAFDQPGTWSQKYNLVWDRILGLGLFPQQVFEKEMAHYKKAQNTYGLPLDNRADYTKLDWIVWTACLTGNQDDFKTLLAPVVKFLNETPDRVPMTDWYFTTEPKKRGFQARPVVGGVFIPLLTDPALWQKWSAQGANVSGPWAPIP